MTALLARLSRIDPWAAVEHWRRRREAMVPADHRQRVTYDPYPDSDVPPAMRFYVEARDARGRLLREYVDLEGYSVHQLNWRTGAMRGGVLVRDWFVGQVLEAMVDLEQRLALEADKRKGIA